MTKDSEGTTLCVGDMVAYNRSGAVARGVVRKITPGHPISERWYSKPPRHRPIVEIYNIQDGKTSKVRNTEGILIIG